MQPVLYIYKRRFVRYQKLGREEKCRAELAMTQSRNQEHKRMFNQQESKFAFDILKHQASGQFCQTYYLRII